MARTRKISQPVADWNRVIAKHVKELRENNGYSHAQFAKIIGVERSVYTRKESGSGKFLAAEVLYLIQYLKVHGPNIKISQNSILERLISIKPQ